MATAGIIQGLAIGWYFEVSVSFSTRSWVRTFGIGSCGQSRKKDLTSRFGEAYRDYQASVGGLWVPKLFRKPIH